ncbi:Uncharacterised protein [Nocardia cyriacigeorgica]|uniref:Uncharacterized protein n=1 Tax=Nocardia cyriacigeorgica TaxID=135487 RepID=A0A4U8W324_9NOCA|nr:Uncharacterised protein [Nocardia cyriacigeorgica]
MAVAHVRPVVPLRAGWRSYDFWRMPGAVESGIAPMPERVFSR